MQIRIAVTIALIGVTWVFAAPGQAQDLRAEIETVVKEYLANHPDEVGQIARNYLAKHPEALQEVLIEMVKRRGAAAKAVSSPESAAVVQNNAEALLRSPHQVSLGNPQGDVTLVEFFDYNCGYCKRALSDMVEMMKVDPKLRVTLKELPVLGPGSVESARVAIAVRMQDVDGSRYLEFHRKLLGERGRSDKAQALTVAKDLGFDLVRLEQDMSSEEADKTLAENSKLAQLLGVTGTPSYVIGDNVVVGAVGIVALNDKIRAARK